MIRLEVREACVGAEGDIPRILVERIRQPALARAVTAPPRQGESPEARVQIVGVAQRVEVSHDDVDTGIAHQLQILGRIPAIHVVNRIGDEEDAQVGLLLLLCDQRVTQLARERACRRRSAGFAAVCVEQEVIDDEKALRAAYDREHLVEDVLAHHGSTVRIGCCDVGDKRDV